MPGRTDMRRRQIVFHMTGIAPAPQRRKLNIDSVGAILLGRFDTSVDNVVATPIWKDDTFFLVAGVRDRDFIVICNATPAIGGR